MAFVTVDFGRHALAQSTQTTALAADEAQDALHRDWLFQAMGEPLAERAAKEIAWAEQLADRLSRSRQPPELSAELAELAALKKQLDGVGKEANRRPLSQPSDRANAAPAWIWYPEGNPAEDAPAATRFFRHRFELPSAVRQAKLRIAADDACEVYLNGVRVGANDTWRQAAIFSVAKLLKPGGNVLAVRAENRPAEAKNPGRPDCLPGGDARHRSGADRSLRWLVASGKRGWPTMGAAHPGRFGVEGRGGCRPLWRRSLGHDRSAWTCRHGPHSDLYFAVRQVKRKILLKNP